MIRLLTVIGHGTNLLNHFISHYKTSVDEINFIVYSSELYPNLREEVQTFIDNYDSPIPIKIMHNEKWRSFDWEHVTFLYNKFKLAYPDDWWVIADIDEFHIYSKTIKEIVDDCEKSGWNFVTGGFLDRIGDNGTLPEISKYGSIWKQFPMVGFFRHPISGACPNKVTLCKGNIELSNGQHYAIMDGETTWKWRGWNHPLRYPVELNFTQVHHFKWDITTSERLKSVSDLCETYSYSDEYKRMYDYFRKNRQMVDTNNPYFMFEYIPSCGYDYYINWNKLTKKIISL